MELDYTCGCKFISHSGASVPTRCPSCREGELCGIKGIFKRPPAAAWSWVKCKSTQDAAEDEWDSKGRPPVKTKCLARRKHQWVGGTVVWHREDNDLDALVLADDGAEVFWAHDFRPLKPEQEQERERDALAVFIDGGQKYGLTPEQVAHWILSAGYKKQETDQ